MPRGPKGEKLPADVIGAAVMVGRIATGVSASSRFFLLVLCGLVLGFGGKFVEIGLISVCLVL
jgi:hypothetical protein